MPLQNRVKPNGEIVAIAERGTMFGNRGGRLHSNEAKELLPRRWANKQWIVCVTQFKGRQRQLMAPNRYTELFFLDEVTALASGHRPCFECRRVAAKAYQAAWQKACGKFLKAGEMDKQLHRERLAGKEFTTHQTPSDLLPDGSMFVHQKTFFAVKNKLALEWSFKGYQSAEKLNAFPTHVAALTPPSSLAALRNGYAPQWHPSSEQFS